jgi:hypothetical protein
MDDGEMIKKDVRIKAIFIASLFIIGCFNLPFYPRADGSTQEKVPKPELGEQHTYNEMGEGGGVKWTRNEDWSLSIRHGDANIKIGVMNLTQKGYMQNDTWISYQYNIMHTVGKSVYIAQCGIATIIFIVGNQTIYANLTNCDDFILAYSPIRYNGTVPEFDCNITFLRISVYPATAKESTFDLTLRHHIRADWEHMDTKIEALFDFDNTRFYDKNNLEFNTGEPFTAELHYTMESWNATDQQNQIPLMPTGYNNKTMNYDIQLGNGTPLTVSRLNMSNNFTAYDENGIRELVGYSSFKYNWRSEVTHGFSNLTYKDTKSIKSDPEIIAFHNRVPIHWEGRLGNQHSPNWGLVAIVWGTIGIVFAIAILVFRRHRRKRRVI